MNYLSIAVIAFWAGWFVNGYRYEHNMQEFINSELRQQIQAYEQTQAKERENLDKALKSAEETKDALDDVTARYNQLLADSLSKSSASSNNSVPAASTPSATVSKSSCKCPNQNREKLQRLLQRLYEQQLIIARDCDITATHYNELIELFNELNK